MRYNANGSLDTSFGNGGKVTTAIGSAAAAVSALAVQPDGKIVGAGSGFVNSKEEFTLARYNANGSTDTSFGSGGVVRTAFPLTEPPPGATKCVVPRVKGTTLRSAERSIKSRNCSVGRIQHGASRTVNRGHVIAQRPKPGAQLAHGAKVNLVVSKGRG